MTPGEDSVGIQYRRSSYISLKRGHKNPITRYFVRCIKVPCIVILPFTVAEAEPAETGLQEIHPSNFRTSAAN